MENWKWKIKAKIELNKIAKVENYSDDNKA